MEGAPATMTKQRCMLQFVTREIFSHIADFVAFRFSRQIHVKSESALLVSDGEGKRLISPQFGAARFVLIITRRRLPFYFATSDLWPSSARPRSPIWLA